MSIDPFIGSRISIISNADVRYEGLLYKLNTEDATLVVKDVKCFGTEGRGDRQVPESARIHDYVAFRGQDIKDLSVIDLVDDRDSSAQPEFQDPAIYKTYNKEEMQLEYGVSTNVHAKPRREPPVQAFPTSNAYSFGDPLLDARPYGSGANIQQSHTTRMNSLLHQDINPLYSGTASFSATSIRQANFNSVPTPFGFKGPGFNDVFQHGKLKQVGVNKSATHAHAHAPGHVVLDAEQDVAQRTSFRHFGKNLSVHLQSPVTTGSHFDFASAQEPLDHHHGRHYYKGNAPANASEALDENADYFNELLGAFSRQRVSENSKPTNAGPAVASLVSLESACALNNRDLTFSTISANDIQKSYSSPLLQHQEDETASTTIPEIGKRDSQEVIRRYASVYDKSKSFFDNLTEERPERPTRHLSHVSSGRRGHRAKGKNDKQSINSPSTNMDTTKTCATDAESRISASPTKSSTAVTRHLVRRNHVNSRKWQRELDAATFGEESLNQLPRHLVEGKRNRYQYRGHHTPGKTSGSSKNNE